MPKLSLIRIAFVTNVLDGKMSFEIMPIGKMLPNQFPQVVRAKQGSQIVLFFLLWSHFLHFLFKRDLWRRKSQSENASLNALKSCSTVETETGLPV